MEITTHLDAYNLILDKLNKNNINFIIIRGFKYLPKKPDTDLDIIIKPNDYSKFSDLIKKLSKEKLIKLSKKKVYNYNEKEYFYLPFFTHERFINGEHLPGRRYRFDTYSDLFFFESKNNAFIVNSLFKNYLFKNKIKVNNYFIPDPVSEVILLIFRNMFDKDGKWTGKHKNRILELIEDINVDEFNYVKNLFYKDDILSILKGKNFELINKPDKKLNIFILRKVGLRKEIIDFVLNIIKEKNYEILDIINIGINEKEKVLKKFYNNYEIHEDNILDINGNKCLCIVTDLPKGRNPNHLKGFIRNKYKDFAPPIGNIIHSSDSSEDCERELDILLDEDIKTFKNVGTYYSQTGTENY